MRRANGSDMPFSIRTSRSLVLLHPRLVVDRKLGKREKVLNVFQIMLALVRTSYPCDGRGYLSNSFKERVQVATILSKTPCVCNKTVRLYIIMFKVYTIVHKIENNNCG